MSFPATGRNAFLADLGAADFALVRPHLSRKELRAGENLSYCGDSIEEVVFPHSGLAIMTAPLHDEAGAGFALVGREGYIGGLSAAASAPASCDSEVLISGQALRMSASAFRYVLNQSSTLRHCAAQFNHAMMAQAQQTALCNAAHSVEARICRWLLDVCDRSDEDRIPFTQSTLGRLLAVRRTTVTLVAGRLEAAGLINCRRGYMKIINRNALEQHCCECYGQLKVHPKTPAAERSGRAAAGSGPAVGQAARPLAATPSISASAKT
jgi:CRP-like cAMP-binding protein